MNTLAPLNKSQKTRVLHVYRNVMQRDPHTRLQALHHYAPQLDAAEKGALFNLMREHWASLSPEEQDVYARLSREANQAFAGGPVGAAQMFNAGPTRIVSTSVDPSLLGNFGDKGPAQIPNSSQTASDAVRKLAPGVTLDLDLSALPSLYPAPGNGETPHRSARLTTQIVPSKGYESIWAAIAKTWIDNGLPRFLVESGAVNVSTEDIYRLAGKSSEEAVAGFMTAALADIHKTYGGTLQAVYIKITAGNQWYENVPSVWSDKMNDIVAIRAQSQNNKWLNYLRDFGLLAAGLLGGAWLLGMFNQPVALPPMQGAIR